MNDTWIKSNGTCALIRPRKRPKMSDHTSSSKLQANTDRASNRTPIYSSDRTAVRVTELNSGGGRITRFRRNLRQRIKRKTRMDRIVDAHTHTHTQASRPNWLGFHVYSLLMNESYESSNEWRMHTKLAGKHGPSDKTRNCVIDKLIESNPRNTVNFRITQFTAMKTD